MSRYRVLLYHGVHPDGLALGGRNRSGKHVPRSRFASEMRWLREHAVIVSMRQIAAAHRDEAALPENAVAVTFDDGFLNNYTEAWPILRDLGLPATIYLATGFIGTGARIWSDRLEAAFLGSGRAHLDWDVQSVRRVWPLGSEVQRVEAYLAVKAICKTLPDDARRRAVEDVCARLEPGSAGHGDHPLYDFMDWPQVKEIAEHGLVDFGAHTVDHVSLARTADAEMAYQIDASLDAVASAVGGPCDLFAYPEGQAGDVDDRVVAHLRARGVDHAPMAIPGSNDTQCTDPFDIRRDMVGFEGAPFPLVGVS